MQYLWVLVASTFRKRNHDESILTKNLQSTYVKIGKDFIVTSTDLGASQNPYLKEEIDLDFEDDISSLGDKGE